MIGTVAGRPAFLAIAFAVLIAACSPPARKERDQARPRQSGPVCAAEWRAVTPGIDYRAMNCDSAGRFDLHLVRVDSRKARIGAAIQGGWYCSFD